MIHYQEYVEILQEILQGPAIVLRILTFFSDLSFPSPSFLGLDHCNVGHLSHAAELMLHNILAIRSYLFRFFVVTLSFNSLGES